MDGVNNQNNTGFLRYKQVGSNCNSLVTFLEEYLEFDIGEDFEVKSDRRNATNQSKRNEYSEIRINSDKLKSLYSQEEIDATSKMNLQEVLLVTAGAATIDGMDSKHNLPNSLPVQSDAEADEEHASFKFINSEISLVHETSNDLSQKKIIDLRNEFEKFNSFIRDFLTKRINSYNEKVDGIYGRACELGLFGLSIDKKIALEYYTISAIRKYPMAAYYYARCFEFGIGTTKNLDKAYILYRVASKLGYPKAIYKYSLMVIRNEDLILGIQLLRLASQRILALKKGNRVPCPIIFYDLGCIYRTGYPEMQKDEKYAFKMFKLGADFGCKYCMCVVGEYYEKGGVVKKNLFNAYKYYKSAAEMNFPLGQFKVAYLADTSSGAFGFNGHMVFEMVQKAANCGLSMAMPLLAKCYINGCGTEKNVLLALYWLNIAKSLDDYDLAIEGEILEIEKSISVYKARNA